MTEKHVDIIYIIPNASKKVWKNVCMYASYIYKNAKPIPSSYFEKKSVA